MGRFEFSFIVFLIASTAIINLSIAGGEGSCPAQKCPDACSVRCSATGHRGQCMDVCEDCCRNCECVPSGTVGNKDECPCYRDMKTKYGIPKCP